MPRLANGLAVLAARSPVERRVKETLEGAMRQSQDSIEPQLRTVSSRLKYYRTRAKHRFYLANMNGVLLLDERHSEKGCRQRDLTP